MRRFALEDLYKFLQIPESEIAKFFDLQLDMDIMKIKKLFYEDEDGFFEYLETYHKEDYLHKLYIYLNLAVDLYYEYLYKNIDLKIYFDTISDIKVWINYCIKEKGTYGLAEIYWINEHLRMRIFQLGRLQFQKRDASYLIELINKTKYKELVTNNEFYFVHIPEGDKLTYDLVVDSYLKAKNFFNDEMIFACESWMLSDRLGLVFSEFSNIMKFKRDYVIFDQKTDENHIVRYLKKDSNLYYRVKQLESEGVLIGEAYGVCFDYISKK